MTVTALPEMLMGINGTVYSAAKKSLAGLKKEASGKSAEELAACGLVAPVIGFASILAGVITTGIKTVCSRSIGSGNRKKANAELSSAAIFSLSFFIVIKWSSRILWAL